MKTKHMTLDQYEELGELFNKVIEDIVNLQCKVPNYIGLTKTAKLQNKLAQSTNKISEVRFAVENIMLGENPTAPLITSYRKYRGEK